MALRSLATRMSSIQMKVIAFAIEVGGLLCTSRYMKYNMTINMTLYVYPFKFTTTRGDVKSKLHLAFS